MRGQNQWYLSATTATKGFSLFDENKKLTVLLTDVMFNERPTLSGMHFVECDENSQPFVEPSLDQVRAEETNVEVSEQRAIS